MIGKLQSIYLYEFLQGGHSHVSDMTINSSQGLLALDGHHSSMGALELTPQWMFEIWMSKTKVVLEALKLLTF